MFIALELELKLKTETTSTTQNREYFVYIRFTDLFQLKGFKGRAKESMLSLHHNRLKPISLLDSILETLFIDFSGFPFNLRGPRYAEYMFAFCVYCMFSISVSIYQDRNFVVLYCVAFVFFCWLELKLAVASVKRILFMLFAIFQWNTTRHIKCQCVFKIDVTQQKDHQPYLCMMPEQV